MLFGVMNILFSCTPHLITSESMVHHEKIGVIPDSLRWFPLNHLKQ